MLQDTTAVGVLLGLALLVATLYGIRTLFGTRSDARDPTQIENCDLFISYSSSDAMLVRPVAERLFAAGLRPWFAEYQVLTEGRAEWRRRVDAGLARATGAVLFLNRNYLNSDHCCMELKQLSRLPRDRICVVILEDVEPPRELPSSVHWVRSNGVSEIIERVLRLFSDETRTDLVEYSGKESRQIGVCTGIPYSLDFGGWLASNPGATAHHEEGLKAVLRTSYGELHVNLWHGRGDNGVLELDLSRSHDQHYEALAEWAGGHLLRYGRKPTGVHIGRGNTGSLFFAVSYRDAHGLRRKYSAVLRHPTTNHLFEFVFTFGAAGSGRLGLTVFGLEMDRLVASLRWPETSPAGIKDMEQRIARLQYSGKPEQADELETFLASIRPGAYEPPASGTELTLVNSHVDEGTLTLEYRWREALPHALADQLDTRVRCRVASLIGLAARAGGRTTVRVANHGRRPAWQLDDVPVPVSIVSAGFDATTQTCWQTIGAVTSVPIGAPTIGGLLTGYRQRYQRIFT
jgi:hypothetical protein